MVKNFQKRGHFSKDSQSLIQVDSGSLGSLPAPLQENFIKGVMPGEPPGGWHLPFSDYMVWIQTFGGLEPPGIH
jgi:hypothetical protein